MNRTEYRAARSLIRANGKYALRWMEADAAQALSRLMTQADDYLRFRSEMFRNESPAMRIRLTTPILQSH